jgi:hypothetical protein
MSGIWPGFVKACSRGAVRQSGREPRTVAGQALKVEVSLLESSISRLCNAECLKILFLVSKIKETRFSDGIPFGIRLLIRVRGHAG